MAAVPLRWKLALCTAGAEKALLPTTLTAGAGAGAAETPMARTRTERVE